MIRNEITSVPMRNDPFLAEQPDRDEARKRARRHDHQRVPMRMRRAGVVRLSSSATRIAERWPCVTRCFTVSVDRHHRGLGDREERRQQQQGDERCPPAAQGHCSCILAPMQNHFENEAAAWIASISMMKPVASSAKRCARASRKPAPREQQRENQPGQHHEQRLWSKRHVAPRNDPNRQCRPPRCGSTAKPARSDETRGAPGEQRGTARSGPRATRRSVPFHARRAGAARPKK